MHMDNSRICKQILSEGTGNVSQPRLHFKDQNKMAMMEFSINVAKWNAVVQDQVRQGQRAMKRISSSMPQRLNKDTNAPQQMTPQYSTTVVIVKNCINCTFVVLAMTSTMFFLLLKLFTHLQCKNKKGAQSDFINIYYHFKYHFQWLLIFE